MYVSESEIAYIMSKRQQPSRGSAQEFAKSAQNTPNKVRKSENKTPKTFKEAMISENPKEINKLDELYNMTKSVMAKLETLDLINERMFICRAKCEDPDLVHRICSRRSR
jgi:esterase/lipase